ncbi:MAG: 3-hydroxyacyl-CoA dehydrogenase [Planctomycetaceae bacterium]|nr:3-hydroxyacyl-CoA dehydrogenase [Planctomycetaceae bacterium]
MKQLENKIALVTGAGRGIGRAIAVDYAAEGARVAVTARSENELTELVEEITSSGGVAVAFVADLSDRNVPAQLVADVKAKMGGTIEILVNNAGVGSSLNPKPIIDFDDDFWDLQMMVNLTAPYLLTKATMQDMLDAKWGRIITIASINSRRASLHGAGYSASKHGVLGFMRTLATEIAGTGVTANCICPGPVKTLLNDKRVAYDAERLGRDFEEHEKSMTLIGGRLIPEDISPMAVYLASDIADMITGQAYNIDGGICMA